ncbi:hypothetical protein CFAM422_008904 [Trichoderma lentiforme]|uniref:Uncharacterized protein n=1 Tax=Trichoderma lentiforme TaxID=1567552 RepID=A0A9P4XBA3_9HYPO|nr:hypothetical protein CFAM422_008904 [Trichoderma lentiforme]
MPRLRPQNPEPPPPAQPPGSGSLPSVPQTHPSSGPETRNVGTAHPQSQHGAIRFTYSLTQHGTIRR